MSTTREEYSRTAAERSNGPLQVLKHIEETIGEELETVETAEMIEQKVTMKRKPFMIYMNLEKSWAEGCSSVKLGTYKKSGESFAIKVITKAEMEEFDKSSLKNKIAVLNILRHDNIIQLHGVFDEKEYIYLVTEKVMGGMLFDRLVAKQAYTEKEARDVCKILLVALEHCHQNQVAHRDLKPENLLLIARYSMSH